MDFSGGKSCLINLTAFYDEMSNPLDEGRAFVVFIFTTLLTLSPISFLYTNL